MDKISALLINVKWSTRPSESPSPFARTDYLVNNIVRPTIRWGIMEKTTEVKKVIGMSTRVSAVASTRGW